MKQWNTSHGTGVLDTHTKTQTKKENVTVLQSVQIGNFLKKTVAEAAAVAFALDHLPVSFTDKTKIGHDALCASSTRCREICVGQKTIKAANVLPCATSVKTAIEQTASKTREQFRNKSLQKVLEVGG